MPLKTTKSADCAYGCRCTRECDNETQSIVEKIGDHITNMIYKKRIVSNSQNPGKGVGYLKDQKEKESPWVPQS